MRVHLAFTGLTPLAMHNPRLSDPMDEYTKAIVEITSKRKKTDADHAEIARLEWHGGLYHTPELGVYLPAANVLRCLEDAAKITKQGTALLRAVALTSEGAPLQYDGPRSPEELWTQPLYRWRTMVGVQRGRVVRVRPIFRKWALSLDVELLEDLFNLSALAPIAELAGQSVGLGDGRKLGYGRFRAEVKAA